MLPPATGGGLRLAGAPEVRFKGRIRPHDAAVVSFCGPGVEVIAVTNPTPSGSGRFPAAVMAPGPRMLVFRVSGYAALEPELKIRELFLTIAGQTAPGDGICLRNYRVNFDTSQAILRHLRFRPGDEQGKEQDGFGGARRSHARRSHARRPWHGGWGVDAAFSINKAANLRVRWCLASVSLCHPLHQTGNHG